MQLWLPENRPGKGIISFLKGDAPSPSESLEVVRVSKSGTSFTVQVAKQQPSKEELLQSYQDSFECASWRAGIVWMTGSQITRDKYEKYCVKCEYLTCSESHFLCKRLYCSNGYELDFLDKSTAKYKQAMQLLGHQFRDDDSL